VAGELKKMTAFIRQEALEKAKEIQIKADEEFAIEKSKLVRQETSSIDSAYEKKFKQASMSQQITRSTVANKTRLRILSSRQELLDGLFEKARGRLPEASKDKSKYEGICKNLILEGCYALNESKVQVRARKQDYEIVKKAMQAAEKEYKDNTKKEVKLDLDEANPQPEQSYVISPILSNRCQFDRAECSPLETGVFPSSAPTARSTSTTPSTSDSNS
jgi:V-type H+-transporting ATPase subunit E